jgi:hypothetical protein
MTHKYSIGEKVLHYGAVGTVAAHKMGGYLIHFKKRKNKFVYESEVSSADTSKSKVPPLQ